MKDLEQIADTISKKYGNDLKKIGKGTEGTVWSIDDRFALKIQKNPDIDMKDLKPIEYGIIDDHYTWIIRDLYSLISNEYQDYIEEVILDVSSMGEKNFEGLTKPELARLIITTIPDNTSFKEKYNLRKNWLHVFAMHILRINNKYECPDLHFYNLGINPKTRNLRFFDW